MWCRGIRIMSRNGETGGRMPLRRTRTGMPMGVPEEIQRPAQIGNRGLLPDDQPHSSFIWPWSRRVKSRSHTPGATRTPCTPCASTRVPDQWARLAGAIRFVGAGRNAPLGRCSLRRTQPGPRRHGRVGRGLRVVKRARPLRFARGYATIKEVPPARGHRELGGVVVCGGRSRCRRAHPPSNPYRTSLWNGPVRGAVGNPTGPSPPPRQTPPQTQAGQWRGETMR